MNQQIAGKVLSLLRLPGNNECADCKTKAPRWACTNHGIFICIKCSGFHRQMGAKISTVKSVTLDDWEEDEYESMARVGNNKANLKFLAKHPQGQFKIEANDDNARERYIVSKYQKRLWYADLPEQEEGRALTSVPVSEERKDSEPVSAPPVMAVIQEGNMNPTRPDSFGDVVVVSGTDGFSRQQMDTFVPTSQQLSPLPPISGLPPMQQQHQLVQTSVAQSQSSESQPFAFPPFVTQQKQTNETNVFGNFGGAGATAESTNGYVSTNVTASDKLFSGTENFFDSFNPNANDNQFGSNTHNNPALGQAGVGDGKELGFKGSESQPFNTTTGGFRDGFTTADVINNSSFSTLDTFPSSSRPSTIQTPMPLDRVVARAGSQARPREEVQMVPLSLVDSYLANGWKLRNPDAYKAAKTARPEAAGLSQQIPTPLPPTSALPVSVPEQQQWEQPKQESGPGNTKELDEQPPTSQPIPITSLLSWE